MYAVIKRIKKPIQKQDFCFPSGEPVPFNCKFPIFRDSKYLRKFYSLNIRRATELVQDKILIIRTRVELKVELRKTFRNGLKVSSKTWHLASIMERNIGIPIKNRDFWQKVDAKLKVFELSEEDEKKIRTKIEIDIPRFNYRFKSKQILKEIN